MNYTPTYLGILNHKLYTLKNLCYLGVSIIEDFEKFRIPIKCLVWLLNNKEYMLSKVKIYRYTWDIELLKGKKELCLTGCELNPADLLLIAEFCEFKI